MRNGLHTDSVGAQLLRNAVMDHCHHCYPLMFLQCRDILGLCMHGQAPRYLADHLTQPLTLLLAVVVYDLTTGTVSLCLAVDSARTTVGRSTMPA